MRILLVNHFPLEGSGSGVYTNNIAKRLLEEGHEVSVVVVDDHRVEGYPYPVRTILYPNFPCFTTHPKSNNTFYNLGREEVNDYLQRFTGVLQQAVTDFKPQLIHCQHLWVAPYVALSTGVPYIITAHGTDIKGYKKDRRYHSIASRGAEKAEAIITISNEVHSQVQEYFSVPSEKLHLILNGFDEKIFRVYDLGKKEVLRDFFPSSEVNNFKEQRIVSFVGKLTDFKGVDLLIRAAADYERRLPGTITLITGDGELRDELQSLADRVGAEGVYFLGNQPQQQVARINNIADLAVFPSRGEPFGLVALEALACGTPVITSDSGGFPDFINNRVGALFNSDDHQDLCDKIIEGLEKDYKEEKGEYAVKYANNNFSWSRVIDEVLEVYLKIL